MSTLAVVATLYRRPWAIPKMAEYVRTSSQAPDELWFAVERAKDATPAIREDWGVDRRRPFFARIAEGQNPLSVEINGVLDRSRADYFTYLTDDSLPMIDKYRRMKAALDENPDWGIVYCEQDYGTATGPEDWLAGGTHRGIRPVHPEEHSPYCRVDHTQVMHRRTKARWPLDYGSRRLSDAHFFVDLVADLGPMHGIPEVLDWTRQLPDGLSARS